MPSIGKLCTYCSKPIAAEERVACCDRCFAAHHEECWDRNGRCSTFRCAGLPRTMEGRDVSTVIQSALERANEQPVSCPYCGNKTYAGQLTGKRASRGPQNPSGPGLWFKSKVKPEGRGRLFRRAQPRTWWLPGAAIRSRSCGRCRRLYLWGLAVDEAFFQQLGDESGERFCPHCSTGLHAGEIILKTSHPEGANFACDDVPDFHRDWIGHNFLDRYINNRWQPTLKTLPAHSCPQCQYTEIAGRPVYRFL